MSGGRGGAGCSSYDTDPYGKGGPDGANGGRGGDVYLVSTDQLANFQMETFHLKGQNGRAGGSSLAKGQNGFSLKVPIPAGTVVSEILSTDPQRGEYKLKFLADMDRPGLEMKVATGGDGGLGNRAFKTQYRKQARFSTIGRVGTARWLHLELKCIADVGLVGYPKCVLQVTNKRCRQVVVHFFLLGRIHIFLSFSFSSLPVLLFFLFFFSAGKSSFLAAISNATPEIANYPFTTLHPQVGVVELGAFQEDGNDESSLPPSSSLDSNSAIPHATPLTLSSMSRMTVADLPGLISGASRANKGLGHEFLKHIQRTKVLCYVLDISGNDDRCPIEDFRSLQQELQHFDSTLLRRQSIIIANKIDNTSKRKKSWMKSKLNELSQVTTLPIYVTSCLNRTGLSVVVQELGKMVEQQLTDDREEGKRMIIEEKRRVDQIERETEEETKMLEAKEWEEKKIEQRQLEGVDEEADNQDDDEDEFVESFQTPKKSPSTSSKRSRSMKKLKSN